MWGRGYAETSETRSEDGVGCMGQLIPKQVRIFTFFKEKHSKCPSLLVRISLTKTELTARGGISSEA